MPNLSRHYCSHEQGDVIHVEFWPYLIVPKPLQNSFKEYIKTTYDTNQIEESFIFSKNIPRFKIEQLDKFLRGKIDTICNYDPHVLASDDFDKIKASLHELLVNNKRSKVLKNGIPYKITDNDVEALTKMVTESGLFKVISKYQSLQSIPLDEMHQLYQELTENSEEDNSKYVDFYFTNFYKRKIQLDPDTEISPIQLKWDKILDWAVEETFVDSEIIMKWKDDGNDTELIDLKIIDIDTKI